MNTEQTSTRRTRDPEVRLEPDHVRVQPGGQVSVSLSVRSSSTVVEGYRLEILGAAARWAKVTPSEVSVYPNQEVSAKIIFSPPAGSQVPGEVLPFGVKVQSVVDKDARTIAEGDIEVDRIFGLQAVPRPVTSHGRWKGRHTLTVANWGNTPVQLRLTAADPDAALNFLIKPDVIDVPLGGMAAVRVLVRTRKPQLRGMTQRLPFQITGELIGRDRTHGPTPTHAEPERPVVDAVFEQRPILTRTSVAVLGFVVVALLAVGTWLYLRPDRERAGGLTAAGAPASPMLQASGDKQDPNRPVLLRWNPVPEITGYLIREVKVTGDGIVPVQGVVQLGPGESSVVAPAATAGRHCYQIQAVRAGSPSSAWSEQACAVGGPSATITTPTPTPSPTQSSSVDPQPTDSTTPDPTPTTLAPTDWVASVLVGPAGYSDAEAIKLRDKLNAKQQTTAFKLVLSTAYAGLAAQAPGAPSDMLISTGQSDRASAEQLCDIVNALLPKSGGFICVPVQPGDPSR